LPEVEDRIASRGTDRVGDGRIGRGSFGAAVKCKECYDRLDIDRHSQQSVNCLGWWREMNVLGYMQHLAVRALDVHGDILHADPHEPLIPSEFQAVEQVLGGNLFDARAPFPARRLRQVGIKLIGHCTKQYSIAIQIHADIAISRVPDLAGRKSIAL
jgi:hypothetical protein